MDKLTIEQLEDVLSMNNKFERENEAKDIDVRRNLEKLIGQFSDDPEIQGLLDEQRKILKANEANRREAMESLEKDIKKQIKMLEEEAKEAKEREEKKDNSDNGEEA